MIEQTKIVKVWHIKENELCCSNKKIVYINCNNVEIAILKEEQKYVVQEFLIKDNNSEYWKLGIAPIRFNLFLGNETMNKEEKEKIERYKKDITEAYKKIDLKAFWDKKIERSDYFNKCELKYIEKHYPEIYEKAKESRQIFEMNRDKEHRKEELERKKKEQDTVKQTNQIFEKELKEMKYKIFIGTMVEIKNFEFYKDDKFKSGKTIQNNILYLARLYGIKIPLATQGFINNRLISYNFKTGEGTYKIINNNKRCSTKIKLYLQEIYKKVQDEYKEKLNKKSSKVIQKEIGI